MRNSIQKYFSVFLLFFCMTLMAAETPVKIIVTADHSDWVYNLNEKVKFKVAVTQNGVLLNNVKISYEIGPEKMTPV